MFSMSGDCITFVGDVYAPMALRSQLSLTPPWVCNLEGPVTEARVGTTGKINLKMETLNLEKSLGSLPAAVSLANNHALDYGDDGLQDTLGVLRSKGVHVFGLGGAQERDTGIARIMCAGLDVALLGYVCPSTHPTSGTRYKPLLLDDELVLADIQQARQGGADRVVLCLHWGQEEVPLPTPQDRQRARAYVDAGADLIVGHHSHCIQKWELIGDCPVFYGLGNFVMPDIRVPAEFDEDGIPRRWYEKKQHAWNRKSLLVEWFPASRRWSIRTAVFRDGSLRAGGTPPPRLQLGTPIGDAYTRRYGASVRRSRLKLASANFLARPRVPTGKRLAYVANAVFGRNAQAEDEP